MITEDVRFRAEVIPQSLRDLAGRLATYFGVPPYNIGMKGNAAHRGGYHRSRNFLRSSPYSRDRHYSVTDAPGNQMGDPNWICAMDITLPARQLIPLCKRLDAAVRSGTLEKIAEWYGNRDGDRRVDGYDNVRNRVASSDDSHLWHVHLGFIRARAGDDHSDVYAVLTGLKPPLSAATSLLPAADEEDEVDQKTGDAILKSNEAILGELQALNDYLMTGKRYGKAATQPPNATQIGLLHNLLQSISRGGHGNDAAS